ncbi:hypothetical protein ACFFRR_002679 [Megaselia abdita]
MFYIFYEYCESKLIQRLSFKMLAVNRAKEFLKIGQLETLFGIRLKAVVLVFIIIECVGYALLQGAACFVYIAKKSHFPVNDIINDTFKTAVLIESGVSFDNISEWVVRIFIECVISFTCLYGIFSRKTSFIMPWIYWSMLHILLTFISTIVILCGFEDVGMNFSTKMVCFVLYLIIIAFQLYKLNGFYSYYKIMRDEKTQRHQIFYDNVNEDI